MKGNSLSNKGYQGQQVNGVWKRLMLPTMLTIAIGSFYMMPLTAQRLHQSAVERSARRAAIARIDLHGHIRRA